MFSWISPTERWSISSRSAKIVTRSWIARASAIRALRSRASPPGAVTGSGPSATGRAPDATGTRPVGVSRLRISRVVMVFAPLLRCFLDEDLSLEPLVTPLDDDREALAYLQVTQDGAYLLRGAAGMAAQFAD